MLASCNSNSSGRDIAKATEDAPIRYGMVTEDAEGTKLAFAGSGRVEYPGEGARFDV